MMNSEVIGKKGGQENLPLIVYTEDKRNSEDIGKIDCLKYLSPI